MLLSDKEVDLIIKHDVDEICFMKRKQRVVTWNITDLMTAFTQQSIQLRKKALKECMSQDDKKKS